MEYNKLSTKGLSDLLGKAHFVTYHKLVTKAGETIETLSMPCGRFYRRSGPDEFVLCDNDKLLRMGTEESRHLGCFVEALEDANPIVFEFREGNLAF